MLLLTSRVGSAGGQIPAHFLYSSQNPAFLLHPLLSSCDKWLSDMFSRILGGEYFFNLPHSQYIVQKAWSSWIQWLLALFQPLSSSWSKNAISSGCVVYFCAQLGYCSSFHADKVDHVQTGRWFSFSHWFVLDIVQRCTSVRIVCHLRLSTLAEKERGRSLIWKKQYWIMVKIVTRAWTFFFFSYFRSTYTSTHTRICDFFLIVARGFSDHFTR